MAAPANIAVYSDALVVLASAGVVLPVFRRLGLNPTLGFLLLGAILGPLGLGTFIDVMPVLVWVTVVDAENVSGIAELGIIFLLFLIGLELSFERLKAMRRLVLGLGSLQILLSALALGTAAYVLGFDTRSGLIVGACLALSSTAIVIEELSRRGRLASASGRASFAILLAQDIAVIPLMLLVSVVSAGSQSSLLAAIGAALLQGTISLLIILLLGRLFLRPLLRLVASLNSPETFMAAVLFVIVGAGFVSAQFGLSMALGAFVAGLLISETEYRKAVEALIDPFKGLLLGLFFFSVGMSVNISALLHDPLPILIGVAVLILVKLLVLLPLGLVFRLPLPAALESALVLASGGEFAFVTIGAAVTAGLLPKDQASTILTVVTLTMMCLPALAWLGAHFSRRPPPAAASAYCAEPPLPRTGHAIIIGYGRVGKVVAGLLETHGLAYTAVDHDPAMIERDRRSGHHVHYGDATASGFMMACGLMEAAAVIITVQSRKMSDRLLDIVRSYRPDIPVIVRAADAAHARHLYGAGATEAVPETIEASLQLSEASLIHLGIPMGRVIASIHDRRDDFRKMLREPA